MPQKKQQSFMMNVGIILFAQIMVKLLGMVYRMVITNIDGFGDAGNGFYSAGYQVYILLLALSSVGIPTAIAKMVSQERALGRPQNAHRIFKVALGLFAVIGLALSALLFFGADVIAQQVIKMEGVQGTLRALAPSIFFVCVSSVINGYFQGMEDMKSTGTAQILEQIAKCTLTILFVVMAAGGHPAYLAALATTATTISTIISFGYLVMFYRNRSNQFDRRPVTKGMSVKKLAKNILLIALPFSLGSIVTAVNRLIDTATITRGIERAFSNGIPGVFGGEVISIPTAAQLNAEAVRLAGMLSKSDTLINLPLAVNVALATVLVPAITAAFARGDRGEARHKISVSMLLSVLVVVPCALGFVVLAEPIYQTIYPAAMEGFELLQLSAIALIFMALNQTMYGALQGMGKIYVPAISLLIGCIVKIAFNLTFIKMPSIHIYGAVISSIACQLASFLICYQSLSGKLNMDPMRHLIKPMAAGLCMSAAIYGIYQGMIQAIGIPFLALAVALLGGVLVYFALVLLLGILTREEYALFPGGDQFYSYLHKRKKY